MAADPAHYPWDRHVAQLVHPTRVAILEAFAWIDEPLSPTLIDALFDKEHGTPLIAYHVRVMADAGLLELTHQKMSSGALQTFYRAPRNPIDQEFS